MQQTSPKLNECETKWKWFEELWRMKAEIVGADRYDEQSLAAHIAGKYYMSFEIVLSRMLRDDPSPSLNTRCNH
jgi:hypothetical protein